MSFYLIGIIQSFQQQQKKKIKRNRNHGNKINQFDQDY